MCIIWTVLVLGLATVASGGSASVRSYDWIPIKDLKSYHALVLKPEQYKIPGEAGYVTMSIQLIGPEDTLAIKLIGVHPEGKAFDEFVKGYFGIGDESTKKFMSKDYSDNLTDKNPESKIYSFLPLKTLEANYSTMETFPGNITEKCIPISRNSYSNSW